MVNPLFLKDSIVRILATGEIATILSLVDAVGKSEPFVYIIETENKNMHHFLPISEIELYEVL